LGLTDQEVFEGFVFVEVKADEYLFHVFWGAIVRSAG
jgi:hypothetical protein